LLRSIVTIPCMVSALYYALFGRGGKVALRFLVFLAIEDQIVATYERDYWPREVRDVCAGIRRQKKETVHVLSMAIHIARGHDTAQRMASEIPRIHLGKLRKRTVSCV